MKTEEVKKLAKEKYGKVLTDEEAKALAEKLEEGGELADEDLENVAGGGLLWQEGGPSGRQYPKMPDLKGN